MIKSFRIGFAGLSVVLSGVASSQTLTTLRSSEPVCSISFKDKLEGAPSESTVALTKSLRETLVDFETRRDSLSERPTRLARFDDEKLSFQDPQPLSSAPKIDHHESPWDLGAKFRTGISLENKRSNGGPLQYPKDAAFGGVASLDFVAARTDAPFYFGVFGETRYYFDNQDSVVGNRADDEWATKMGARFGGLMAESDCSQSQIFTERTKTWEVKAFSVNNSVLGMDSREQIQGTVDESFVTHHTGTEIRSSYGLYYTDNEVNPALGSNTGNNNSWGFLCNLSAQQPVDFISDKLKVGAHGGLMIDEFSTLWSYKWGVNATLAVGENCGIVIGYDRNDIDGAYGQDEVIYVLFETRMGSSARN